MSEKSIYKFLKLVKTFSSTLRNPLNGFKINIKTHLQTYTEQIPEKSRIAVAKANYIYAFAWMYYKR